MPRAKNKPIPEFTEAEKARFHSSVDHTPGLGPTGECWPFKGPFTKQGYGRFYFRPRPRSEFRSNRVAYFLDTGIDPGEHEVLHSCDWPPCSRPTHLSPGSRLDNAREAVARGLTPTGDRNGSRKHPEALRRGDNHPNRKFGVVTKGDKNGFSKYTVEQIKEMRRLHTDGAPCHEIARHFRAGLSTVQGIVSRRSWKHVA